MVAFTAQEIITVPCHNQKMSIDTLYTDSLKRFWIEGRETNKFENFKQYLINIRSNSFYLGTEIGKICFSIWRSDFVFYWSSDASPSFDHFLLLTAIHIGVGQVP